MLANQARQLVHVLEHKPPPGALERLPIKGTWSDLAEPLKPLRNALDESVTEVAEGRCEVVDALAYQRQALADFDTFYGQAARLLESLLDVAGLATLSELVRPHVKRRGRPPKTPAVDEYPDLVARPLAAGGLEEAAQALRTSREKGSDAQEDVPSASAGEKKIVQPVHESQEGEKKTAQPLHDSQTGEKIITQPLNERSESRPKISQPLHESGEDGISGVFSEVQRERKRRKRIVFGVGGLGRGPTRRDRQSAQDPAAMPLPALSQVRTAASHWWRRLRRAA